MRIATDNSWLGGRGKHRETKLKFLSHTQIDRALNRLIKGRRLYCAVAFWGDGAAARLRIPQDAQDVQIVCNLKMGGTNPREIRVMQDAGVVVRQCDQLHAKVYIGDDEMIVTSANASSNGLAFGDALNGAWIEAGAVGEVQPKALSWFKALWKSARPVEPADLEAAQLVWDARRRAFAGLASEPPDFWAVDLASQSLPLLDFYGDEDWDANENSIADQVGAEFTTELHALIEAAVDVRRPEERDFLKRGTWVLKWNRTKAGQVGATEFEWVRLNTFIKDGYRRKNKPDQPVDVMLPMEYQTPSVPVPFDAASKKFHKAFARTMMKRHFAPLRKDDEEGAWFTLDRMNLFFQFWQELKDIHPELSSSG